MSCKEEVVLGLEEVLLLLPSYLFDEVFIPFPQSYRGGSNNDWKPMMWYALNHYSSMEKPSEYGGKPRGTGVFLPARPVSSSEEKPKKKQCPVISSHFKQVYLPKEWAY